ncbi:ATP-binding protein [Streptomyces sp. NPDC058739]|uniref:ATP-binding protein n=1 Tax=Streptomyces sp. NPDC058739 TaxID=3346618 RepID=UPI00367432EC
MHREIAILDELENEIEDPDLLKGLFHVDHLATRIRRHAENLAVLGGAVSRRQWSNPVSMTEVLRSAIAEVEQYSRVKLVPPVDGELRGHAVADVIHLLAELVENATVFSSPHTQVLLRANLVTSGLAVEVEDRGLGMPVGEQSRMNELLADPDQVNVASLLADGRIGLFVVSQLAKRHGITVRLQSNIYGGVQAVLVVPQALLGGAPGPAAAPGRTEGQGQSAVPGAPPVPALTGQPPQGGDTRRPAGPPPSGPRPDAPGAGQDPLAIPAPYGGPDSSPAPHDLTGPAVQPSSATALPGGNTPHTAQPEPPAFRPLAHSTPPPAQPGAPHVPLPVRGARVERPNPADAAPGIRPGDRPILEEHGAAAPVPRNGAVRGTMGKPRLPRRRAQEHIVPQLRERPAPRPDAEEHVGHDPGLMAAFQRGIGLAETRHGLEATHDGLGPVGGHPPLPYPDLAYDVVPAAPEPRTTAHPADVLDRHSAASPVAPPPAAGSDHTARHDGSAPAG